MRKFGIGAFAPAGFANDPDAARRGLERLAGMGHRVIADADLFARHTRFAGPDEARLQAFARMAAHPDVEIALALRGGYGTSRLLERLDFAALARAGKRWVGHSDFTAFQLAALARAGMVTFAGPTLAHDFGAAEPSAFTLGHCFGLLGARDYEVECALDGPTRFAAAGVLWGSNLTLTASLVGTPYFPSVDGGILVLEDVAEHPYRVERMLLQLHHAGVLARQRAIVLGAFTGFTLTEADGGYDLAAAIASVRARCATPIFTGLPFGHVPDKLTLPIGGRVALDVLDGAARLRFGGYG